MNKLPKASGIYGAQHGRPDVITDPDAKEFKIQRLRLNGDYDEGGAYWGAEQGIYIYRATTSGGDEKFVRAGTIEEAINQMRETWPNAVPADDWRLREFYESYLECALFTSSNPLAEDDPEQPEHLDDTDLDLALEAEEAMRADCRRFMDENRELLDEASEKYGYNMSQAGHDFWLTRNGHGAGFWDRGLEEIGEKLSEAARAYGEDNLYVGDDNLIYCESAAVSNEPGLEEESEAECPFQP